MKLRYLLTAAAIALGTLGFAAAAAAEPIEPSPHEMNIHSTRRLKIKGGVLTGPEGEGSNSQTFEDACGVAVPPPPRNYGEGQYLYVSDYYHDSVDVFQPYNAYSSNELFISKVDPTNGPCGLAVDTFGDVFVNTWHENVLMFTPSDLPAIGSPTKETEYTGTMLDETGSDTGVAVLGPVQACGWCAEEQLVYVDTGTAINEYAITNKYQNPREISFVGTIGADPSADYYGIGVSNYPSTKGFVYVAEAKENVIKVFNPAESMTTPVEEQDGAGTPQRGFAHLGESTIALDNNPESPSYGHLYVTDNIQSGLSEHPQVVVDEFNPAGDYRGQISRWIAEEGEPPVPTEHWLTASEPTGLAIGEEGGVLVTSGNDQGSEDRDRNNVGSVVYMFEPMKLAKPLAVEKTGTGNGLVTSAPAGIYCGTACEAEYTKGAGEIVTLTAAEDSHSTFVGWGGDCSGTQPVCHIAVENEGIEVVADFARLPQQQLNVTVSGTGSGTVTSEPIGLECTVGACSGEFTEGSSVTLNAQPEVHSRFVEWRGAACDESTELSCRVTMGHAEAVEALFEAIPQQDLAVSVTGTGTLISEPSGIFCPANCSGHFDAGSVVDLKAVPAPHQEVAGWTGCSTQPAPDECSVAMSSAKSVTLTFAPVHHRLAIAVSGRGTVDADHGTISGCGGGGACSALYLEGEVVQLTADPAANWTFLGWSGGHCGRSRVCEVGLNEDMALTADFAAIPTLPPSPGPPPASIKVRTVKVLGTTAVLKLEVSSGGTLKARGRGIQPVSVKVGRAGPATLRIHLTNDARRELAKAKGGRLNVPVVISFVSISGASHAAVRHIVTFTAGHKHGHHRRHGHRHHSMRGR